MSKQELFDRIRRNSWQRQLSIRALPRKYGLNPRPVREARYSPVPTPRRRPGRTSPRMEPYKKTVDAWLQGHPLRLIALGTAAAMAGYRVHYTPPPRPW